MPMSEAFGFLHRAPSGAWIVSNLVHTSSYVVELVRMTKPREKKGEADCAVEEVVGSRGALVRKFGPNWWRALQMMADMDEMR